MKRSVIREDRSHGISGFMRYLHVPHPSGGFAVQNGHPAVLSALLHPGYAVTFHAFSVVSIGEIERGIRRCANQDPAFAESLTGWLETLLLD